MRGRRAIVCGAAGGIGGAVATALAGEGVEVVAVDIDRNGLGALRQSCAGLPGTIEARWLDLNDDAAVRDLVASLQARGLAVDILFNNTGGPPPSSVMDADLNVWRMHFDAMVLGIVRLTNLVLPGMLRRGWGRVITSASSGVVAPIANLGLSNSLRSVLVAWSKTLANEVGSAGITSNVMIPGRIASPRIAELDEASARRSGIPVAAVVADSVSRIPARRYGRVEEYGAVAAFLASEQASFVNGSMIRVDGGMIGSV